MTRRHFERVVICSILCLLTGSVSAALANAAEETSLPPVTIMPLGDSITKGTDQSVLDIGYRRPLYLALTGAGYVIDFVGSQAHGLIHDFDEDHEGHSGWTDSMIAVNVYDFLQATPAELILLHIGTNDLDTATADVAEILDEIDRYETDFSVSITVFLARIINQMTYNPTVTEFNGNIAAMAQARIGAGDQIVIVDMENGAGINYTTEMGNNLHPNDDGYTKMGNKWFAVLDSFFTSEGLDSLAVEASSPGEYTTDDLTCSYMLTGTSVTAATAWYRNNSPAMTLYFPFEGNNTNALKDFSGNGVTASTGGDPTWDASGGHDGFGAWEFDGSDHLSAGENFPTNSSYTKTAWVYRTGSANNNILSGDNNPGGHVFWAPGPGGNKLTAGHNGSWTIVEDSIGLSASTWYFVGVTFDYATGEMTLYRDGNVVDTATLTGSDKDVTDATLFIGRYSSGNYWNGRIDDVRVYDYVLSPTQIMTMYTTGIDVIKASETSVADQWKAHVTPFSATGAGDVHISNTVTINDVPTAIPPTGMAGGFGLHQNVPNPFNPLTLIRYDVPPGGSSLSITIYDVTGRPVRTLFSGFATAGRKIAVWDGRNHKGHRVASGVYFYRLLAPGYARTRKMTLIQ